VLAKRSQSITIVGRNYGRYWGAAVDEFDGIDNVDLIVAVFRTVASPTCSCGDDETGAANGHALVSEVISTIARPIVKGDVQSPQVSRFSGAIVGVNSINWGSDRSPSGDISHCRGVGAPERTVDFTVPDGKLRRPFSRLGGQARVSDTVLCASRQCQR